MALTPWHSTKRGPDAFEEEIAGTNYAEQEYDDEGQCVGEHCQKGGGAGYQDEDGGEGEGEEEEDEGPPVDESNVLVLDKTNFNDQLKKHPFLLIEFYAPWCGHCKSIKPEYAKAADALVGVEPKVTLAKIDTIENDDIGKEFDIQGFPTMKWFVNGEIQEIEMNERTADGIIKWCKKKSGNPAPMVEDKEKLSDIVDNSRFAAVGFFQGEAAGEAYDAFKKAATEDGKNEYYTVTDAALAKENKVHKFPAIVFFRNFEEKRIDHTGKFTSEAILEAAKANSMRTVIEFNQENGEEIFANDLVKVLLFGPDRSKNAEADFLKLAKEFKGKFVFASVAGGSDPELWS